MTGEDTIFALSTAPGRAGVAVIRVSGPRARAALAALGGPAEPAPRRATLAELRAPGAAGEAIDRGLVLWFPAPHSFTGEDQVELHLHGGPAVVAAALEALAEVDGLRPAEAGEFTRRAFDNDKLDLAQVEGLADLIAAETEAQRRQALRQMAGGLSEMVEAWRERLVGALARLEAAIDFPDEDLPEGLAGQVEHNILYLVEHITQYLGSAPHGERLRSGFQIAIVGPPNVGKSSLLNVIARRDAAIVSETAGTTRDVIEVHLDLGGYPVTLIDTAGVREARSAVASGSGPEAAAISAVEEEGMRRARVRAADADLKLVMSDARAWPELAPEARALLDGSAYLVLNKVDLTIPPAEDSYEGRPTFAVSATEGTGIAALLDRLEAEARERLGVSGSAPSLTRLRHRRALEDCRDALRRALEARELALMAEDLRLAARALGRITGRVDVEDILDALFREFCIGK